MAQLLKKVETYRVGSEAEAEAFIRQLKEDPEGEGYELKGYKRTKKEKKAKGEIIDEWYIVEATKVWDN